MDTASASAGPSLLPYLNALKEGIYIKFRHTVPVANSQTAAPARPGRINIQRHADISVNGRQALLDVICICQPDLYPVESSVLNPLTNQDIESIWQETWRQIGTAETASQHFVLPCQIDEKGGLVQLKPLLFCSHKQRYGHPLCPACARDLDLCVDDNLLANAGLPTYSGSMTRYLYCESCHRKKDGNPFYIHKSVGPSPANVKDSDTLMKAFSGLLAKSELSDKLPCIGCDETANCYGAETLILKRMQPIQFYPFHMLIQNAATLDGVEFIMLLSGADAIALEHLPTGDHSVASQKHLKNVFPQLAKERGYLFGQDDRLFLEILYLKLTFLQEVISLVRNQAFSFADRISLEGIGVQIDLPGAKLPGFWNFSLQLADPVGFPGSHPKGSILPDIAAKEFLGLVWCYLLMANDTQPLTKVINAVKENMGGVIEKPADADHLLRNEVFKPGNIFWYPQRLSLPSDWLELWLEALVQGFELVNAGQGKIAELSLNAFDRQLEQLRKRIHGALFTQSADVREPSEVNHDDLDTRIGSLLETILEKWSHASPTFPPASPPTSPIDAPPQAQFSPSDTKQQDQVSADGDFTETIILSGKEVSSPIEPHSGEPHTELEKTVILPSSQGREPGKETVDDLEETVVTPSRKPPPVDADLDKTIVLNPSREPAANDDLEETVLISSTGSPEGSPGPEKITTKETRPAKRNQQSQEDEMEKTVIIRPDRGQNGKSKS